MIAGLIALVLLVTGGILLGSRMVPTIQAVRLEMSLTPTPVPPMSSSVWAVTINPAEPTPLPPLGNGSRGERVTELQTRLQALGYYQGEIDGQFGAGTREAVIAFQRANGLDADGLAGSETLALLESEQAKRAGE